jgi:hypothetical protein
VNAVKENVFSSEAKEGERLGYAGGVSASDINVGRKMEAEH